MKASKWDRMVGVNIPLKEYKRIYLNKHNVTYYEVHNVKRLEVPFLNASDRDIPLLLIVKGTNWYPKNASGWGSSGPEGCVEGGHDISNYKLTNEEIIELIGHLVDEKVEFRTTEKNMRQWIDNEEIIPPRCQHIHHYGYTEDTQKRLEEIDKILRDASTKKFHSKDTIKKYFFYVDEVKWEFESKKFERIDEGGEDVTYRFYLYEKDGNFRKCYNPLVIYG